MFGFNHLSLLKQLVPFLRFFAAKGFPPNTVTPTQAAQPAQGKGKDGRLKICLLTTGPGKTLGDAALCEKLAASFLEKYNVEIDTRIHLIEDSQKDKAQNLFKPFDQKYPGQHRLFLDSDNLDFNNHYEKGFNSNDYDLVIPFAAYNLFPDDFKLKTQFFSEKANIGFIKANRKINANLFPQKHPLITFIEHGNGPHKKYYAHIKTNAQKGKTVPLDSKQANILRTYFEKMERNRYHYFSDQDPVRAAEFDVVETTRTGVKILKSKTPASERNKKADYFNTAYQLQTLVKDLSLKNDIPFQDKCVHLTRYDYFSDEYLASLKSNDIEFVGVDRGDKAQFGEIFSGGQIQNIQTGFGKNKHGIMLPQVPSEQSLNTVAKIKQDMDKEDLSVIDLIYGKKDKKEYEKSNELFFGYHNIIPNTDISALPISGYIKTCIDITKKTKGKSNKNIDFILNANKDDADACNPCKISELLKGINLEEYDVEFWKKGQNGVMEKCCSIGNCDGKKPLIRLINPFGIKHQSFLTLLRLAEPLTLQTGNSSIIEAFYLGKIPLYQLTTWSEDFLNALQSYVSDTLGENAYYTKIFKTANDKNTSQEYKIETISAIYRDHMQALQVELKKLVAHMKEKMDLYKNLPTLLKEKFQVPLTQKTPVQQQTPQEKEWAPHFNNTRQQRQTKLAARKRRAPSQMQVFPNRRIRSK